MLKPKENGHANQYGDSDKADQLGFKPKEPAGSDYLRVDGSVATPARWTVGVDGGRHSWNTSRWRCCRSPSTGRPATTDLSIGGNGLQRQRLGE